MTETRKIAAILAADVVGYGRLVAADEEGALARLRALRSDLVDPTIAVHRGRVVKRMGDGLIAEFRSVVSAVRCAIEMQSAMVERNAGVASDGRIEFRIGVHLGDVVEEADGDLMGDGVNIAARLEGICEPGGICLSDDAYRQVRDKVKETFVDRGEKALKNIARAVRVYGLELDCAVVSLAAYAVAIERTGPPRLSIVVLPFVNISGDPEHEYFVDGVTESLTSNLSMIRGAVVIARNTAFTYKGKPIDVKTIGRELNVRYVLEGSVQRAGNRLRVNVQLIDAESGSHLWTELFDKRVADLFDMQDEIVARLSGQLNAALIVAEARRVEKSPNPDAFDLYLQGMAWLHKAPFPESLQQARSFFGRALAIEPYNVNALIGCATADYFEVNVFASSERSTFLAAAEASLLKALSVAPDSARAHLWLSLVKSSSNRADQGLAEAERALELDRNLALALVAKATAKLFAGFAEEAVECHLQALRLSPRDPYAHGGMAGIGAAKLHLGDYEGAAKWLSQSVAANPNYSMAHFYLAAALGQLGRLEGARAEAKAGLALHPTFTISRFRDGAESDNPFFLQQRHNIYEGLRKAGLPEH
jgi:TolB-like protein/class 3 adenylate cyclase